MLKTKIMIVEDEKGTAMITESELISMGHEICCWVTTGEDAIKGVEKEKPDIILMDINLNGEMDGIDSAREIRSRHDIPIIFMTGCDDEETKKRAEEVGPIAYLIKPVGSENLKVAIDKAFSIK